MHAIAAAAHAPFNQLPIFYDHPDRLDEAIKVFQGVLDRQKSSIGIAYAGIGDYPAGYRKRWGDL